MLILVGHATTPDKLKLITSAAGDVDTYVSYIDCSDASPPVPDAPNKEGHLITTAATTDILAGVTNAAKRRNVKNVSIRNVSTTVSNDVTVVIDAIDGNDYELHKSTLLPGERLGYDEGVGWFKTGPGFDVVEYVRKSAQQSFSATSFADVTGMGFAVAANAVYEIEYDIQFRSATVTVGVGLAINGPASPTSVQGTVLIIGAQAAGALTDIFSAGFVAYDTPNLTTLTTNSTSVTYAARLSCLLENGGTAGTIIPRWRSETATATTVEVGSFGTCKRIK